MDISIFISTLAALILLISSLFVFCFHIWMIVQSYKKSLFWFLVVLLTVIGPYIFYLIHRPKISKKYIKPIKILLLIQVVMLAIFIILLISPSF